MRARWMAAGMALVFGVGYACTGDILASVHFNSTGTDLAVPPAPLLIASWEERATRDVTEPRYDGAGGEARGDRLKRVTEAAARTQATAVASPSAAGFTAAARAARAEVELGEMVDSARDRAELFEVLARTPSPTFRDYLRARALLDADKAKEVRALFTKLVDTDKINPATDPIASHWLYLDAMAAYTLGQNDQAADEFDGAAGFKTSRRAPALIMLARTLLRGGTIDENGLEKTTPRSPETLARAKSALDQLDAEFGGGRFAWSSLGWRGRTELLRGNSGTALAVYLRQLDRATSLDQRINALSSIRQTSRRLQAKDTAQFRAEVAKDPTLLRPYLDYRIHHTTLTSSQRTSLYAFAREFGLSRVSLGGDLRASLAEMALLAGDTAGAVREANAALAAGTAQASLAHYVIGGVAMRAGDLKTAEPQFRAAAKGKGPVARGALEPLALILERTKRPGEAADIYRTLDYTMDYAYLLDAKMSLAELKAYAERQPESRSALVRYAYGMRLLRAERFDEAEAIFADLGNARLRLAEPGSKTYAWMTDESSPAADVLFDPLVTARDLRAMKRTIEGARGEAKPEAMYALASYYYTRRNLLLYNASLWKGDRVTALGMFWSDTTNDATDRKTRIAHAYEHECLARARATCLAIAKQFPESPWAAKALYRAATAERRLADFNPMWRDLSRYGTNFWRAAAGHLEELATRFPNDPLATNARKYAKVFQEEAGDGWKAPAAPAKPALLE